VIVLNGASSAGKSTLALALQQALAMDERPWVVFSWDDFVPRLPERWTSVPGATGDQALDGCSYRIVRDEPLEALLEVGEMGSRLLRAYHRSVAAVARSGINVIVEEVLITRAEWDDWQEALGDLDVRWVGVRCDVDTAERREIERGDRYPGLARGTSSVTHIHPDYDLNVDTSTRAPEVLAAQIVQSLAH
jgi:chloramphenicol 3-O phosphotransferase